MAGIVAQTGSASAGLRFLALLAALAPAPAYAGAWIAPEDGQEIWTNVAGQRDDLRFFETSAYWEIPFAARTAFVAAPWFEQAADRGADGWQAEALIGVKQALLRGDHGVMALQAGAVWTSEPAPACGEGGGELRWLGGRSFGETGRGFVNIEAAARVMSGGCGDQRFELTAGYRPDEKWLAMAQVFTDAPDWGERAVKAQLTLVRFGEEGRGVQFGLRGRIDGAEIEPALVVGFWGLPGR